jgi:hypothetical protein
MVTFAKSFNLVVQTAKRTTGRMAGGEAHGTHAEPHILDEYFSWVSIA